MDLRDLEREDWKKILNAAGLGMFFVLVVWAMQLCTT